MNWPDFTKRSNAIAILLAMQLGYFIATFASWFFVKHYGGDTDLWKWGGIAFAGNTNALMLALKMGGPDTPNPPDATSGSSQTTTTTTAATATTPEPPKEQPNAEKTP